VKVARLCRNRVLGSSLKVAELADEAARAHLAPLRLLVEVYVGQQPELRDLAVFEMVKWFTSVSTGHPVATTVAV
jgi:hypothetical protein